MFCWTEKTTLAGTRAGAPYRMRWVVSYTMTSRDSGYNVDVTKRRAPQRSTPFETLPSESHTSTVKDSTISWFTGAGGTRGARESLATSG